MEAVKNAVHCGAPYRTGDVDPSKAGIVNASTSRTASLNGLAKLPSTSQNSDPVLSRPVVTNAASATLLQPTSQALGDHPLLFALRLAALAQQPAASCLPSGNSPIAHAQIANLPYQAANINATLPAAQLLQALAICSGTPAGSSTTLCAVGAEHVAMPATPPTQTMPSKSSHGVKRGRDEAVQQCDTTAKVYKEPPARRHMQRPKTSAVPASAVRISAVDLWEPCAECGEMVNVGGRDASDNAACGKCGTVVATKRHAQYDQWIQCDTCGKWRRLSLQRFEELKDAASCRCCDMFPGMTCKSTRQEWTSIRRRRNSSSARALHTRNDAPLAVVPIVSDKWTARACGVERQLSLHMRTLPSSSAALEFVPGRDMLHRPRDTSAGIHLYDAATREHVLCVLHLPQHDAAGFTAFVNKGLEAWACGELKAAVDGRASAGAIDLTAYLAQTDVKVKIKEALQRRKERLMTRGVKVPAVEREMLHHVVHVAPDNRRVFIGDEYDVTHNGGVIMDYHKSWQSCGIRSWTGGLKVADMAGARPNKMVQSKLSELMEPQRDAFVAAVERVWDMFACCDHTRDAAARMLAAMENHPIQALARLGRSGWNAYSLNIDYRTGRHVDGKNIPGSYSALLVFESGASFCGGMYALPQYNTVFDVRPGLVLFHRSGDGGVGLHGNTELHLPDHDSHRVSIVLYQTTLVGKAAAVSDKLLHHADMLSPPPQLATATADASGDMAEDIGHDLARDTMSDDANCGVTEVGAVSGVGTGSAENDAARDVVNGGANRDGAAESGVIIDVGAGVHGGVACETAHAHEDSNMAIKNEVVGDAMLHSIVEPDACGQAVPMQVTETCTADACIPDRKAGAVASEMQNVEMSITANDMTTEKPASVTHDIEAALAPVQSESTAQVSALTGGSQPSGCNAPITPPTPEQVTHQADIVTNELGASSNDPPVLRCKEESPAVLRVDNGSSVCRHDTHA